MIEKKLYDSFHISDLLLKKLNDGLSSSEEFELAAWLSLDKANQELLDQLLLESISNRDMYEMSSFNVEDALAAVRSRINTQAKPERFGKRWLQFAAAVAVLTAFSITLWIYNKKSHPDQLSVKVTSKEILPGMNKAVLILSNGTKIDLQNAATGTIARQSGVMIKKTNPGNINYQRTGSTPDKINSGNEMNTMYIPKGGQYQLTLPDGSRVWLNAASTLKFPVTFDAGDRTVELSGEAYFEVAHELKRPFRVKTNDQVVEVLGTHFNVEAYADDDNTTTTLFEGSVKVNKGPVFSVIKPGQMTVNMRNSTKLMTSSANGDEALAWKNGYFNFNDDTIQEIMKRISRWYNVDVEYRGEIQEKHFWGTFSRTKNLSSLLKSLEQTKTIHFKQEGRRVIVMP